MQKRAFAPEFQEGLSEITEILVNTEEHMVCNLSFGVFDGTKMVGYVFAYVEDKSLYYNRIEDVIYVKEIVLLPGYERLMRKLFTKLQAQRSAFAPKLPYEAHVVDEALRNWQRLVRMFRHYGLKTSSKRDCTDSDDSKYNILRFDRDITAAKPARRATPLPDSSYYSYGELSITMVTDPGQWLSLKSDWSVLLHNTDDSNVFQSFDYLWQWWKFNGIWNDLKIIVFRRGKAVVGIVPLMAEYFDVYGKTLRKWMFMTAPMEMSRPKLIFGRHGAECIPAFIAYLERIKDEWDVIDIDEQMPGDATNHLRNELASRNYRVAESETLCPYIRVDGDWKGFLAARTKKMRSNINRLRRRIVEVGEVSVDVENQWPNLQRAMDQFCDVESKSWKPEKMLDISSNKESYFFYYALAETLGRSGNFELRTLKCGGNFVSSTFGIRSDGVFQSLKIAHDKDFDRYSPGTVLESYEIEDLIGAGLSHYEFMGSFLSNKLRWTSTVFRTSGFHVYQRQPRLALYFFVYFVLKRKVKKILRKTGQFERAEKYVEKLQAFKQARM